MSKSSVASGIWSGLDHKAVDDILLTARDQGTSPQFELAVRAGKFFAGAGETLEQVIYRTLLHESHNSAN